MTASNVHGPAINHLTRFHAFGTDGQGKIMYSSFAADPYDALAASQSEAGSNWVKHDWYVLDRVDGSQVMSVPCNH